MAVITRRRPPAAVELDQVALHARNVAFDWTGLPLRWIPDEAFASHLLNVLHILLPEGERFFVKTFTEALPLIQDDRLREDVVGFIGQEAMHASTHQIVQDYFARQGLDTSGYVREVEHLFRVLLGDRGLSGRRKQEWLVERLALVAGIEHITSFLGDWVLNTPGLDGIGADPRMLDLLRWHGAEEVEHRAVAFDLYLHLDGRYLRRVRAYATAGLGITWLWMRGVHHLMTNDPTLVRPRKPRLRDFASAARRDLSPTLFDLVRSAGLYLRPSFHPSQVGSTSQAVAYLASSPAAVAADGAA